MNGFDVGGCPRARRREAKADPRADTPTSARDFSQGIKSHPWGDLDAALNHYESAAQHLHGLVDAMYMASCVASESGRAMVAEYELKSGQAPVRLSPAGRQGCHIRGEQQPHPTQPHRHLSQELKSYFRSDRAVSA